MAEITTKEALYMNWEPEPATDTTIYEFDDNGEALRTQCCKYF